MNLPATEMDTEEPEADDHRAGLDRRGRRVPLHNPERRTGFDRRRRYPFTGPLRDDGRLVLTLVLINALSALDFFFTYVQLVAGVAEEGNPVLAELFRQGPGQAWLFKTAVMIVVSLAIWRSRQHRAILSVALGALALYVLLIAYHFAGMAASGLL